MIPCILFCVLWLFFFALAFINFFYDRFLDVKLFWVYQKFFNFFKGDRLGIGSLGRHYDIELAPKFAG